MVEHYVLALRKRFLEDMRIVGLNTCRSSIPSALRSVRRHIKLDIGAA